MRKRRFSAQILLKITWITGVPVATIATTAQFPLEQGAVSFLFDPVPSGACYIKILRNRFIEERYTVDAQAVKATKVKPPVPGGALSCHNFVRGKQTGQARRRVPFKGGDQRQAERGGSTGEFQLPE